MVKKNERGITLIALVITIIILIILAGISINLLLGENGIITRSKNAKEQHEYAAAKEIIDLKLADIYTDAVSKNEEYTMSKITTGMTEDTSITIDEKYFNATGSLKTGVSDSIVNLKGIVVSANQYERFKFLVSGVNGANRIIGYTTESVPNTWTTGDLPTGFIAIGESKQATPPIGQTTYTVTFKDGETTLSTQTVNEGETATKPKAPTKAGNAFAGWFSNSELTTEYDFTSTITENTTIYAKWTEGFAGTGIIEKGQTTPRPITTKDYGRKVSYLDNNGTGQMANKTWRLFYVEDSSNTFGDGAGTIYLKADWWDNDYKGSTTYNSETTLVRQLNPDWAKNRGNQESEWIDNEKAAASLCDPTASWETNYKSTNSMYTGKINWVVGAPSVEMFMKSYSQRVEGASNYGAKYGVLNRSEGTAYGYEYTTDGSKYDYYTNNDVISPLEANGMYLKYRGTQDGKCCYEWLSSPSYYWKSNLCFVVGREAYLAREKYDSTLGACPLVSVRPSLILQEID